MNNMYTIGGGQSNPAENRKGGKALRYLSPSTSVEGGQRRREVNSRG
jgi:hypothetical protein